MCIRDRVKAVPLPPPPSSSTFGVTLTDSPIESSPVRQPTLPPMAPVQPPWFAKWGKLSAGALALFLISFFAAKLFLSSQGEKVAESPPPKATAERLGEQSSLSDKREKEAVPASVTPTPLVPPLVGRVTTAEELLPIRIFGAAPNDELRGVNAFRVQVEAWVPEIREVYNVQLAENPQALGAAILELRVVPEGQVVSAAVHVTGSISRSLQQTILDAVKTLRFAPVQGEEVKVFYPLLFSPEKVDPVTFVSHVKEVWPGRYKVLSATAVPVHAEASDDAQEVGTIGPGLFVSVVSSRDGWLGALSPKGKVGYVRQETIFPRIENTTDTDVKG